MSARIEVVCVGTELLSGKINTHIAYFAEVLHGIGLSVSREGSILDSVQEISAAVKEAYLRSDVVIVCGGLGPTFDDLSREGTASALGLRLHYQPKLFAQIKKRYARYYKKVPEENKRQAYVIDGAKVLNNNFGSAPGQWVEIGSKTVILLPGPFSELKPMFDPLIPLLKKRHAPRIEVRKRVFHLCGIPESFADEKLSPLFAKPTPDVEYTILAQPGQVDFHVSARGDSGKAAEALLRKAEASVRKLVGDYIFGTDDDAMESVLGKRLRAKKMKLAVAESCTGGLLSGQITNVAGSSDYFLGSVVSYANEAKVSNLAVSEATLRKLGAVSEPCAKEMAEGALHRFNADIALSITGIAGPGGGTRSKPVGLVFMGLARKYARTRAYRFLFAGSRDQVRKRSVTAALTLLYSSLI